jgi:hypothetical protein
MVAAGGVSMRLCVFCLLVAKETEEKVTHFGWEMLKSIQHEFVYS